MTDQHTARRTERAGAVASFASGGLLLAAALMTGLLGASSLVIGGTTMASPGWLLRFSVPVWGWIHLVLGLLMAVSAAAVIVRSDWGRVAAIVLALISMVSFFFWLPYYPLWSIVMIAIDVVIVWAIATWDHSTGGRQDHGGRSSRRRGFGAGSAS